VILGMKGAGDLRLPSRHDLKGHHHEGCINRIDKVVTRRSRRGSRARTGAIARGTSPYR
jgi:hypothetical protein